MEYGHAVERKGYDSRGTGNHQAECPVRCFKEEGTSKVGSYRRIPTALFDIAGNVWGVGRRLL